MRCIILVSSIMTFIITTTRATNETNFIQSISEADVNKSTEGVNISTRQGRQFQLESQFFGMKPQVHIIKIPSRVSKVKLIGSYPELFMGNIQRISRPFAGKQSTNPKSETFDGYDHYLKDPTYLNSKKVKRNLKKQRGKELGFENYYSQETFSHDQNIFNGGPIKGKTFKNSGKVLKNKKKMFAEGYDPYVKHEETDLSSKYNLEDYNTPNSYKREEDSEEYYDFEPAASTHYDDHRNLPPKLQKYPTISPGKTMKPSYLKERPALTKYGNDYFLGTEFKNQQSKREPFFHQLYTTHNSNVMTNFGLPNTNNIQQYPTKVPTVDSYKSFSQQTMAGSEQVVNAVPFPNPGIKVIQPPKFRDVSFSGPTHPPRSSSSTQQNEDTAPSQKATIRDILEQDCPSYEKIGFCESPPRYPMHQIKNIIKKCSIILEAMNTQNFEDQKTVLGFSKRSGFASESENGTAALEAEAERLISQKKILSDNGAACHSEAFLMEPGYAREVVSGKWFVIVQDPDLLQQKIVTDTCTNSGQPCGGLLNLNCSRLNGNALKSTRCIQRFSYQKLITWDPDYPDSCPKMRVFKFPSACVCHLGSL